MESKCEKKIFFFTEEWKLMNKFKQIITVKAITLRLNVDPQVRPNNMKLLFMSWSAEVLSIFLSRNDTFCRVKWAKFHAFLIHKFLCNIKGTISTKSSKPQEMTTQYIFFSNPLTSPISNNQKCRESWFPPMSVVP